MLISLFLLNPSSLEFANTFRWDTCSFGIDFRFDTASLLWLLDQHHEERSIVQSDRTLLSEKVGTPHQYRTETTSP